MPFTALYNYFSKRSNQKAERRPIIQPLAREKYELHATSVDKENQPINLLDETNDPWIHTFAKNRDILTKIHGLPKHDTSYSSLNLMEAIGLKLFNSSIEDSAWIHSIYLRPINNNYFLEIELGREHAIKICRIIYWKRNTGQFHLKYKDNFINKF
ncbi:hypothetical protein ACP8HI_12445 [Paenibacillus sp. FA6]|uniref:hypothetical protein n=1 Tax=Paenibacillus sp. FA6 TaxID=3413029 RepID=UPI003F6589BE